jgi:hypothetical protein
MTDFWKDWIKAKPLQRQNKVKYLLKFALPKESTFKGNKDLYYHSVATLINSYFEDLEEYIRKEKK